MVWGIGFAGTVAGSENLPPCLAHRSAQGKFPPARQGWGNLVSVDGKGGPAPNCSSRVKPVETLDFISEAASCPERE